MQARLSRARHAWVATASLKTTGGVVDSTSHPDDIKPERLSRRADLEDAAVAPITAAVVTPQGVPPTTPFRAGVRADNPVDAAPENVSRTAVEMSMIACCTLRAFALLRY